MDGSCGEPPNFSNRLPVSKTLSRSSGPSDPYVGGWSQMKLVEGVKGQAEVVRSVLESFSFLDEHGIAGLRVRPALVFMDAEFGLFPHP